jgi:integrase
MGIEVGEGCRDGLLSSSRRYWPYTTSADTNDDRRLQRHFGSWSARRLDDISSADVERRLREIASRSGRYESNRSLALLRVMFNHAIRWKMRPSGSNPCTDLKPYKEQARSRYLVPDELRRVLTALDEEADPFWQAYFKIALLLGPRRSELLSAEWRHVHFDTDPPTIEFPTTKAGRAHTLPLPGPVVEILKSIPKLDDSPFVFPGRGASGHLVEPKKAWNRIRKGAGVSDVRVHDLRRTLGSWLASSGYGLPLVGKILNHTNASTTQVYARVDLAPVKAALDANAERMLAVLG